MHLHVYACIDNHTCLNMFVLACICIYKFHGVLSWSFFCIVLPQEYVMFILQLHYGGIPFELSPAINECWYRHINLIFKIRWGSTLMLRLVVYWSASVRWSRLCSSTVQCPIKPKCWLRSTVQVGTKLLHLQSPDPVVYVVQLSHILGKLPLIPAGDTSYIPRSMHWCKDTCYPLGIVDCHGDSGSGNPVFYINSWAMIWPVDY